MADLQSINIGNRVNDGTGDDLRSAFEKVNANFADLNLELTVTVSNIGTTGYGLFKQKTGTTLEFKNLVAGENINLTSLDTAVQIGADVPAAFQRITSVSGSIDAKLFPTIGFDSNEDINVTIPQGGSIIKIKNNVPVTRILTYYDFGPIDGEYSNSVQLLMQASNIEFGTITYAGRLDVDCGGL